MNRRAFIAAIAGAAVAKPAEPMICATDTVSFVGIDWAAGADRVLGGVVFFMTDEEMEDSVGESRLACHRMVADIKAEFLFRCRVRFVAESIIPNFRLRGQSFVRYYSKA
jgi:hypothetical protein